MHKAVGATGINNWSVDYDKQLILNKRLTQCYKSSFQSMKYTHNFTYLTTYF